MYSYRVQVYDLYHAAHRKAVQLVLSHAKCPPSPMRPRFTAVKTPDEEQQAFDKGLRAVEDAFEELNQAVEELRAALPKEVRHVGHLGRHLMFTRHYPDKKSPDTCAHDAADILLRDLPLVLERFDAWYETQSRLDAALILQLEAFTQLAHVNSAVREGWAAYKSRSVGGFDLSQDIDGEKLAIQSFGSSGVLRGPLSDKDCEAYLNLLRGLWAVGRNPVVHNDAAPNPAVADAVLTLLSYVLARLEDARPDGDQ